MPQMITRRVSAHSRRDVRCLCPRCLQDYFLTNEYYIRRADPYALEKDSCLRCDRPGYDYILIRKTVRMSNVR